MIPYFGLQVYSEHFKLLVVKQTHPDTEIEMYFTFVMLPGKAWYIWTDKKSEGTKEKAAKLRKES